MRRYLRQMGALVWKDLVLEARTRVRVGTMAAFSVLVGVLLNFSFDPAVVAPRDVAAGFVWVTVVFAGLLGVGRTFRLEADDDAFQGVLLSPIPRDALYLAKVVSNFVLVGAVALLVLAVFALFFGVGPGSSPAALVAVVLLGVLGFVALGTLFAAISTGSDLGETLLPVLLFPLLVPIVIYGASATGRLLAGRPVSEVEGHLRMLAAFAVVCVFAGSLLFRFVVED